MEKIQIGTNDFILYSPDSNKALYLANHELFHIMY